MNFFRHIASNLVKGPVPGDAGGEGASEEISDAELVSGVRRAITTPLTLSSPDTVAGSMR